MSHLPKSSSAGQRRTRLPSGPANNFIVMLNSNEGSLSIDLLNRSLPIRLAPTGDVTQLQVAHWKPQAGVSAGQPQADRGRTLGHDRQEWVKAGKTTGRVSGSLPGWDRGRRSSGVSLLVNDRLKDFLGNYSATRGLWLILSTGEALLSILAFHNANNMEASRVSLLKSRCQRGGNEDASSRCGCQQRSGGSAGLASGIYSNAGPKRHLLPIRRGDTGWSKITYLLLKKQGRFGNQHPHYRYPLRGISPGEG